jgi:small subunit ribosomal protein S20
LEKKVANTIKAKKRAIQSEKHRKHNIGLRSYYRTAIKKVIAAIEAKNKTTALEAYKAAQPILDGMVNKGIIHKNKAARHKSNLCAAIARLS